ncbi:hypothetical protein CR51_02150 [Caballeronia megalochromosomata]|nr:hypothetical protein CR51_02150 [Caballeronia megalochromosomata]
MQLRKAFGLAVSAERRVRDLTQAELAERADLTISAVSMLERGTRAPNFDTLERISSALEVPLWILFRAADDLVKSRPDL